MKIIFGKGKSRDNQRVQKALILLSNYGPWILSEFALMQKGYLRKTLFILN